MPELLIYSCPLNSPSVRRTSGLNGQMIKLPFARRKYPIPVFHHIPKCGGTPINSALEQWFNVKRDYISAEQLREVQVDLDALDSRHREITSQVQRCCCLSC